MELLKRHAYLVSIAEQTDQKLGDSRLVVCHADASLMFYRPLCSNPWISDPGQAEWLLENHRQVIRHGRPGFLRRIFALPTDLDLTVAEVLTYQQVVKAVIHMQLFEGVSVGIWFVRNRSNTYRFDFSLAESERHQFAWPCPEFYLSLENTEAVLADSGETNVLFSKMQNLQAKVIFLTPYRTEHFQSGERVHLPLSWRQFLFKLQAGRCVACGEHRVEYPEIDHTRPLHPEENPYYVVPGGNSTFPNIAMFCRACNRKKSNRTPSILPEANLNELIPEVRLRDYFRASLVNPPDKIPHELPSMPSPAGLSDIWTPK
jgi:5-methylcytosine-specific restriction endonuclease McrA